MRRMFLFAACILTMSGTALAASRAYDTGSFNAIEISAGIHVDIVPGPDHRVVAETGGADFDDLQIRVEKGVLRIGRPARNWFSFGRRADYHLRVQSPALRSISASSGSRVTAEGGELATGAFALHASSGSNLEVQISRGNAVTAKGSSGSRIYLSGTCQSIRAQASSGSHVDAEDLRCEKADVAASSGSNLSVAASRGVVGTASSGARVKVRGKPAVVDVEKSSGAGVVVRD